MEENSELDEYLSEATKNLDPQLISFIRISEKASVMRDLRALIYEKQEHGDSIAVNVLGWALDRLAN